MEWQRRNEASIHRTAQLDRKFIPLSSLLLNCRTTNADRLQHRWTHQLLRGSALLPRPSTLKLTSLLLASEASLRLAFYARRRLALRAQAPLLSLVETPTQSSLRGGMQCKNEVSIHRTARHFSIEGGVGA